MLYIRLTLKKREIIYSKKIKNFALINQLGISNGGKIYNNRTVQKAEIAQDLVIYFQ